MVPGKLFPGWPLKMQHECKWWPCTCKFILTVVVSVCIVYVICMFTCKLCILDKVDVWHLKFETKLNFLHSYVYIALLQIFKICTMSYVCHTVFAIYFAYRYFCDFGLGGEICDGLISQFLWCFLYNMNHTFYKQLQCLCPLSCMFCNIFFYYRNIKEDR